MSKMKMKKSNAPKEIYVRVVPISQSSNDAEFNLTKIKEEYDRETNVIKSRNILSGGSVGATIGLIACLASVFAGAPMHTPEAFVIVGASLLFGLVAGFILY